MGRKYIQFVAEETPPDYDWGKMILAHTGEFTPILAENWDSSDSPLPQPGYRLTEYYRFEELVEPAFTGSTTHRREGNWEVTRVEVYDASSSSNGFDTIAVCYCRYSPISAPLVPVPQARVSRDSFENEAEYQTWQVQQQEKDALASPS
jgi:hypothetical protein